MKLQPVTSTNIYAIGHDGQNTMQVRFLGGENFAYSPITAEDHSKLMNAHSIGAHLNKMIKGTKILSPDFEWTCEDDDMGNTTRTAPSPIHDEGTPFLWRIKPRLSDNKVEWYECHDLELMDKESLRAWPTVGCAKAGVEDRHAEMLAEGITYEPQPAKEKSLCDSCAPDDGPCELQHIGIVAVGGYCNRYQEVTPL
jgi:hypothetical protein